MPGPGQKTLNIDVQETVADVNMEVADWGVNSSRQARCAVAGIARGEGGCWEARRAMALLQIAPANPSLAAQTEGNKNRQPRREQKKTNRAEHTASIFFV